MRHPAQNPAQCSRALPHQSQFHLVQRTPQGPRVIGQDLTFTKAVSLANEIPGAVVKFSRMEVV